MTESDEKIARGQSLARRRAALPMSQTQFEKTVREMAGPTEATLARRTILKAEQGEGSEDTFRYYEAWLLRLEGVREGLTPEERSDLEEIGVSEDVRIPFTMTVRIGALDYEATVSGDPADADLIREQMTKLTDAAMRRGDEKHTSD